LKEEQPAPPPLRLKPWYYQEWFLFPVFPFWPVWAVLILRSPWHNGLVSGAVAWAMLFVGAYWIGWLQLYQEHRLNEVTISLIIPGLLLTVITQVHWVRYRGLLRGRPGPEDGTSATPSTTDRVVRSGPGPRTSRPRRRVRRR
jgi:hypothetical protein